MLHRASLLIILTVVFCSCASGILLEGFDSDTWKNDPNGCKGQRQKMVAIFQTQKELLMGLSENDLKRILGNPDKQELFVRSQKFFAYHIDPAPTCPGGKELPMTLTIRFNALGFTNEVFLENLN